MHYRPGDRFVKMNGNGNVAYGYPKYIKDYWPDVPDNLDAVVTFPVGTTQSDVTYFFKVNMLNYIFLFNT